MKILLTALLALTFCVASFATNYEEITELSGAYTDYPTPERAITDPQINFGFPNEIAFPWKNRTIGIDIGFKRTFDKVTVSLRQLNDNLEEVEAHSEDLQVYASDDNKTYKRLTNLKISHKSFEKNNKLWDQITVVSAFDCRFLKFYIPWNKDFYVFGSENASKAFQVFAEKFISFEKLSVPFAMTSKTDISFLVKDFTPSGNASLKLELLPEGKIIWEEKLSNIKPNVATPLKLDLNIYPEGKKTLHLFYSDAKNPVGLGIKRSFMLCRDPLVFLKNISDSGYETKKTTINGISFDCLTYPDSAPIVQFQFDGVDGTYAIYAALIGKGDQFMVGFPSGKNCSASLGTWFPEDARDNLSGETFLGLSDLKTGDKIKVKSLRPDAKLLYLRAQKVTDTQKEIFLANPLIKPTVIAHDDGYSTFYFKIHNTAEDFKKTTDNHKNSNLYEYNWQFGSATAFNYPSKIGSIYGDANIPGNKYREGDTVAINAIQRLIKAGTDPIKLLQVACRENNIRFALCFTPESYYAQLAYIFNGKFYFDHPEYRVTPASGILPISLSFAYPQVRDFYISILKEVLAYKPDSLMIEFHRTPPFFGFDEPVRKIYTERYGECKLSDYMNPNWQKIQCEIMTDFIGKVRKAIDEVNPKIHFEVSFDCLEYYKQGLDVQTWLKNGWIDLISPGFAHVGYEKYFPLGPFNKMVAASSRKCLIFPRIECGIMGKDPTPDSEKGLEIIEYKGVSDNMHKKILADFSREGADGVRLFNGGSPTLNRMLSDRASLKKWETFEEPLLDIRAIAH